MQNELNKWVCPRCNGRGFLTTLQQPSEDAQQRYEETLYCTNCKSTFNKGLKQDYCPSCNYYALDHIAAELKEGGE